MAFDKSAVAIKFGTLTQITEKLSIGSKITDLLCRPVQFSLNDQAGSEHTVEIHPSAAAAKHVPQYRSPQHCLPMREFTAGTCIWDAADSALFCVQHLRCQPVCFVFNDIVVEVQWGDDRSSVIQRYNAASEQRCREYTDNKAEQDNSVRQRREKIARRAELFTVFDRLIQNSFSGETELVELVGRFVRLAHQLEDSVPAGDYTSVAAVLRYMGYQARDAAHLPESEYRKPDVMARWLLGWFIDMVDHKTSRYTINLIEHFDAYPKLCD